MKRIFGTLAMMAAFFCIADPVEGARAPGLTKIQHHLISRFIEEAAAKERIEPALIRSIISVESAFNFRAVSRAGAVGLMQIMPRTAEELGDMRALDHANPRANILAGSHLLRRLINRYQGNLRLALAAYNAGPNSIQKYRGIPPFPETRGYVKKVLAQLRRERRWQQ